MLLNGCCCCCWCCFARHGSFWRKNSLSSCQPPPTRTIICLRRILTNIMSLSPTLYFPSPILTMGNCVAQVHWHSSWTTCWLAWIVWLSSLERKEKKSLHLKVSYIVWNWRGYHWSRQLCMVARSVNRLQVASAYNNNNNNRILDFLLLFVLYSNSLYSILAWEYFCPFSVRE